MNRIQEKLIGIYMIFFTVYSLATRFTLTSYLTDGIINSTIYRLLLAAGCILALWQLWTVRDRLRSKDIAILLLFILILCIGVISNHSYGLMDNLYGLVTFGFQLVLFYTLSRSSDSTYIGTWIGRSVFYGSILWNIACIGSVGQFLANTSYMFQHTSTEPPVRQGLVDGRLFGLFTDPNFAAFTSLLLCYGLWFLLQKAEKKAMRIYLIMSILFNCIYIVLSNSRTVYLSVIGSVLFFSLFRAYKAGQEQYDRAGSMALHLFKRGVITILCIIGAYVVIFFPVQGVAKLVAPDRDTATEMVRDDVNDSNISNNRFAIWEAYWDLYTDKPVFGFSLRSALPYAEKNYPGGYLDQTKYVTHNSYLSLLVETGITGFAVFTVFFLMIAVKTFRGCKKKEPVNNTSLIFLTWILSILIFGLCFHDIFFTMNFETLLFWMGLGYLNVKFANQ